MRKALPSQQIPHRWWIYQRERFPIVANSLLIAAFSFSAVSYSALQRGAVPSLATVLIAFATTLIFFLQLRIADEFKDFEDDLRFRPYRPVPRGLVSLHELGTIGVASGIIQLGMAVGLGGYGNPDWMPVLGLPLVFTWLYLGLMTQEFFVGDWLKAHPLIYTISHMVIMPLIYFYATACDWLVAGANVPAGIHWFLLASFFSGIVIEVGRKIRAPKEEEIGVETYSYLWGRRNAVLTWLAVGALTGICAVMASQTVGFLVPVVGLVVGLIAASSAIALSFLKHPVKKYSKKIEWMSGLWTLLIYLSLGVIPLLLKLT